MPRDDKDLIVHICVRLGCRKDRELAVVGDELGAHACEVCEGVGAVGGKLDCVVGVCECERGRGLVSWSRSRREMEGRTAGHDVVSGRQVRGNF